MSVKYGKTQSIVLVGLFTALIAVGAFIKIPVPYVPMTLQVFFTTMAGLVLGPWLGAASAFCYMALGLVGLPIFTAGGGFWYVFQPTFGYIIAFIIGSCITGLIANKNTAPSYKRIYCGIFAGLAVVYAIGVLYLYFMSHYYVQSGITLWKAFYAGCLLCAPGDIVTSVLAGLIFKKILPILSKYRKPLNVNNQ